MAGAVRKLNLGAGSTALAGYINIEKNPRCTGVDILRDLRLGLPFADSSVDEILASHIVEHLTIEELLDLMEECFRVLKPGAEMKIVVPLLESATLDHKLFPSNGSFDCFAHDAAEYFNRNFAWELTFRALEPKRPPEMLYEILTVVFRAKKDDVAPSDDAQGQKLNLGCGPYPIAGYVNIDVNPRQRPDLLRDVRKGLPYDDASVDHVVASHFLEHLSCDEMLFVMEECWRVLKPGCLLSIVVPVMEFSTLDHKQVFAADAFDIFGRDAADYFNRKFAWAIASKETVKGERGEHLRIALKAVK